MAVIEEALGMDDEFGISARGGNGHDGFSRLGPQGAARRDNGNFHRAHQLHMATRPPRPSPR
jgi:hypothetical protein